MLAQKPPLRIIVPGRTFRADHDATHSPMFHQVEGLVVDRTTHMGHLKGCLIEFCRAFFGVDDLPVRFRPSYFPFTEPSAEVDIGCSRQGGELKIGAGGDWLEILGSGMVHPKVLANCGVDPAEYQGFAFGMGIERVAMLKYGIPDLRTFYDCDLRWLRHYGFVPLDIPSPVRGRAVHEVHAVLAQEPSRHRGPGRRHRRAAGHARPRCRGGGGPLRRARGLCRRPRRQGRAAPERRSPAGLRRRCRAGRGAGGVRRAERAHRHEGRVRPGRGAHPEDRRGADRKHDPRRRLPGHADVGGRTGAGRGPCRHHRIAGRRAGRHALRRAARPRRPGDRPEGDAEPRRLPRRARHRPRPRGGRGGTAEAARHDPGRGTLPLADRDPYRGPTACPLFLGRHIRGLRNGPSPRWLQGPAGGDRAPADLDLGRHHQFPDLRPEPAAARLRRRQAQRAIWSCASPGPARGCWR